MLVKSISNFLNWIPLPFDEEALKNIITNGVSFPKNILAMKLGTFLLNLPLIENVPSILNFLGKLLK